MRNVAKNGRHEDKLFLSQCKYFWNLIFLRKSDLQTESLLPVSEHRGRGGGRSGVLTCKPSTGSMAPRGPAAGPATWGPPALFTAPCGSRRHVLSSWMTVDK